MKISITIAEAVEATGLSRSTLYSLIATGQLPKRKCGTRTLILVSDLEAFIAELPATPAESEN